MPDCTAHSRFAKKNCNEGLLPKRLNSWSCVFLPKMMSVNQSRDISEWVQVVPLTSTKLPGGLTYSNISQFGRVPSSPPAGEGGGTGGQRFSAQHAELDPSIVRAFEIQMHARNGRQQSLRVSNLGFAGSESEGESQGGGASNTGSQ